MGNGGVYDCLGGMSTPRDTRGPSVLSKTTGRQALPNLSGVRGREGCAARGRVPRRRIDTRRWQVLVWFRKYRMNCDESHPTSGQSLSGVLGGPAGCLIVGSADEIVTLWSWIGMTRRQAGSNPEA